MTRGEFVQKIFRDIYANVSPKEMGFRQRRENVWRWQSDFYDWRIVVCYRSYALLYATHRESGCLSMVRRYKCAGGKVVNESIKLIGEEALRTSCRGCMHYLGGGQCRINAEAECREGGGFELFVQRSFGDEQSGTQSAGERGTAAATVN